MRITENSLKWIMRLYPPLLLQRIWVQKIHKDFMGADIKINRSVATLNLGNAIFGGTIYTATDPFYAMLLGQIIRHKGYKITVWIKSASIMFLRPAKTDLYYSIIVTDKMIEEIEKELSNNGIFVKEYSIELYSKTGELYALATNEVYIKKI